MLRPDRESRRNLITYVSDRPGHDRRYAIDPTKIETELGWRAEQTFATGIAATVKWYLDNEWWWRPLRERVYSGSRLGLLPAKVNTRRMLLTRSLLRDRRRAANSHYRPQWSS